MNPIGVQGSHFFKSLKYTEHAYTPTARTKKYMPDGSDEMIYKTSNTVGLNNEKPGRRQYATGSRRNSSQSKLNVKCQCKHLHAALKRRKNLETRFEHQRRG